jgi:hypothetical protein
MCRYLCEGLPICEGTYVKVIVPASAQLACSIAQPAAMHAIHSLLPPPPQGALIPEFHQSYWMGLRSTGPWPNFTWVDPYARGPSEDNYQHWGKGAGEELPPEPNNFDPPENCGLGNYSQSFDAVWGWGDAGCMQRHIFMCKIRGRQRAAGSCCSYMAPLRCALCRAPGSARRLHACGQTPCGCTAALPLADALWLHCRTAAGREPHVAGSLTWQGASWQKPPRGAADTAAVPPPAPQTPAR